MCGLPGADPAGNNFLFSKIVEEEYKDNSDIVFMGISIDRLRDREKWLKMMKKENLHGVQLFDDTGKIFCKQI